MKTNIHKINGFIYVTSEEEIKDNQIDNYTCIFLSDNGMIKTLSGKGFGRVKTIGRYYKIILTNDPNLTTVQQLTKEEEAYCITVDSVEVEKYTDYNIIDDKEAPFFKYQLQLPKERIIVRFPTHYESKQNARDYGNILVEKQETSSDWVVGFQKRYTDQDMTEYALYILNNKVITAQEWFNQNKKK